MHITYSRTNWEDAPSSATKLSAENLNNIEDGIEAVTAEVNRVSQQVDELPDAAALAASKVAKSELYETVCGVNLFDPQNVLNASISNNAIAAGSATRTGYIKCKPNTAYTFINLNAGTQDASVRFVIGTTTAAPADGVSVSNIRYRANIRSKLFTTDAAAKYIVFYFYIAAEGSTMTPEAAAQNILFAEGTVNEFSAYEEKQVIRSSLLPTETDSIERFSAKQKVYAVKFSDSSSAGVRIADASEMKNTYVIGSGYANGNVNDFDNAYPWNGMRRCNVTVNANGSRAITYEDTAAFASDGSNGNVYVRIPKFYSCRRRSGNSEVWAVTGMPTDGFEIEPAFIRNGKELDAIFVGAYQFSNELNGVYSYSGAKVRTGTSLAEYRGMAENIHAGCLDLATLHAIQMLFAVEFADRNTDTYMQGVSHLPWFSSSNGAVTAVDNATITIQKAARTGNFRAGQNVMLTSDDGTTKTVAETDFTIVSVTESENTIDVELDRAPDSLSLGGAVSYYLSGQAQNTGKTDALAYHTGRIGTAADNALSPFRYRYIENLWGNAWELIEGLRVKDLLYYYTFNPIRYADASVDAWHRCASEAPEQPYLGDDGYNRAWITRMGYQTDAPLLLLPEATQEKTPFTSGASTDYSGAYSSAVYTIYKYNRSGAAEENPHQECLCLFGGGYDHGALCGLFTMRFWYAAGKEKQNLHTARLILR